MEPLTVYVPAEGSFLANVVASGSAIVGSPEGDRIRIDYEGNLYGALNLGTFEEKLALAASRHLHHYPTVARAWVPASEVAPVGRWAERRLVVEDAERLRRWLEEP